MDDRFAKTSVTFDDVLLVPRYSDFVPSDVETKTKLTKNIALNIPFISSPMDTVTESAMAIALAKEGGLGIIHKNLSIQQQTEEVYNVKRSANGIIIDPVTLSPDAPVAEAQKLMDQQKVSGVPITLADGKLAGIITRRDMRFLESQDLSISEVMTKDNLVTATGNVTLEQAEQILTTKKVEKLLLVDESYKLTGLITIKDIDMMNRFPQASKDLLDGCEDLIKAGADAVKVGIGPGSICTTRVVSGVGVPQITAIHDAAQVAAKYDIPIIADGGVRYSGDVSKAIAAGANVVMIGGLFAGLAESPGETILYQGRTFKVYRGMGSLGAMVKGSKDRYRQGDVTDGGKLVPEGVEGRVPFKGNLSPFVYQLVGGLRAGMGYCGTRTIEELRKEAKFIRVTPASVRESHPHDIAITQESPNYSPESSPE